MLTYKNNRIKFSFLPKTINLIMRAGFEPTTMAHEAIKLPITPPLLYKYLLKKIIKKVSMGLEPMVLIIL